MISEVLGVDFALKGKSLSEMIVFLTTTNLLELIPNPIFEEEELKLQIKDLFKEYKKQIE